MKEPFETTAKEAREIARKMNFSTVMLKIMENAYGGKSLLLIQASDVNDETYKSLLNLGYNIEWSATKEQLKITW